MIRSTKVRLQRTSKNVIHWLAVLAFALCGHTSVGSDLSTHSFQGSLGLSNETYGHSFSPGQSLTVRFAYDTTAPKTHELGPGTFGYIQEIPYGFQMLIGDFELVADSYAMFMGNDVPSPGGPLVDRVAFALGGPLPEPQPTPSVRVNGEPVEFGFFTVELLYTDTETLSDASLPSSFPTAAFLSPVNGLADDVGGAIPDLLFTLMSQADEVLQPGDYNFDGVVNDDDYERWVAEFGRQTASLADGNGDAVVDAADYVVWRNASSTMEEKNAGHATPSSLIPEPSAAGLLLAGMIVGLRFIPCRAGSRRRRE